MVLVCRFAHNKNRYEGNFYCRCICYGQGIKGAGEEEELIVFATGSFSVPKTAHEVEKRPLLVTEEGTGRRN